MRRAKRVEGERERMHTYVCRGTDVCPERMRRKLHMEAIGSGALHLQSRDGYSATRTFRRIYGVARRAQYTILNRESFFRILLRPFFVNSPPLKCLGVIGVSPGVAISIARPKTYFEGYDQPETRRHHLVASLRRGTGIRPL
jgi:hypothetical protein